MSDRITEEARAAYGNFIATRERIDAGELEWSAMGDLYTDDVIFVDPGWGRIEGRDNVVEFLTKAMSGLSDWVTPEQWVMVDGPRVVAHWEQVVGQREDGGDWKVPGMSVLYYAGDGKFCYEMDLLNIAHLGEVLDDAKWSPTAEMNFPHMPVDRNWALPAHRQHLAEG